MSNEYKIVNMNRKNLPHASRLAVRKAVIEIQRELIRSVEERRIITPRFDPEAHLKIVGEHCGKERR